MRNSHNSLSRAVPNKSNQSQTTMDVAKLTARNYSNMQTVVDYDPRRKSQRAIVVNMKASLYS